MRSKMVVVVLAVLAGVFVYSARCHAAAHGSGLEYGFVPHTRVVVVPHGRVGLSSYGTAMVDVGAVQILAVHVRATVTNETALPWSLDASAAIAEASRPLAINADTSLPYVVLAPNERRAVDFFFAIPDEDLDGFTFEWAGARGAFSRGFQPVPAPGAGNARRWWFDPNYAWPFFHHVDGVVTRKTPTAAIILWLHDPEDSEDEEIEG